MAQVSDIVLADHLPVEASDVVFRYRRSEGEAVDATVGRLPVDEVLAGLPIREFRSWRGRKHYSGWYWSATTGGHVVYESRLELARILLADQDPDVVAIAAQPFLMEGIDGTRTRRHVPDLLLGMSDGAVTLVDVKPAHRLADAAVVAQMSWTREICIAAGWGFELWSGADPVLLENVRFLAGYRRPGLVDAGLIPVVLDEAAEPIGIGALERVLDGSQEWGLLRPVVLHLLWSGQLVTDLLQVLDADTVVRTAAGR
jgi:hypothetical protein